MMIDLDDACYVLSYAYTYIAMASGSNIIANKYKQLKFVIDRSHPLQKCFLSTVIQ